jgi:hypothetical protein
VGTGSQENPHMEGQLITFTCPRGFVPTGPNSSVCARNGEWEPDPREVDCIGAYAHNSVIYHGQGLLINLIIII